MDEQAEFVDQPRLAQGSREPSAAVGDEVAAWALLEALDLVDEIAGRNAGIGPLSGGHGLGEHDLGGFIHRRRKDAGGLRPEGRHVAIRLRAHEMRPDVLQRLKGPRLGVAGEARNYPVVAAIAHRHVAVQRQRHLQDQLAHSGSPLCRDAAKSDRRRYEAVSPSSMPYATCASRAAIDEWTVRQAIRVPPSTGSKVNVSTASSSGVSS